VVRRLSKDLNVDITVLNRCIRFARTYPRSKIYAARHKFTWTHYRELLAISDVSRRNQLEESARRHDWSSGELALRIKSIRSTPSEKTEDKALPEKPLTPLRGRLYTYKLVQRPALGADGEKELLLDLGFGIFRDMGPRLQARFASESIVESRPKEDSYSFYESDRTEKDLYTYTAYVEKVIDGDTLKVRLDLGFNVWTRQILRLRGIDCPEVGTSEGDEARNFVRSHLKEAQKIIVRSSRSDKYDRYLADVFIPQGGEPDPATDVYLNNFLLETGRARRVG